MRYVSIIPTTTSYVEEREVKRAGHVRAITPISSGEKRAPVTEHPKGSYGPLREERREVMNERRKVCRRVSLQAALIKLRSGIDRRRRNLRQGDVVEHIDEKA